MEKKRNFSELEIDIKEQEKNKRMKLCWLASGKRGFNDSQKQHVWKETITAVNVVGVANCSPVDKDICRGSVIAF